MVEPNVVTHVKGHSVHSYDKFVSVYEQPNDRVNSHLHEVYICGLSPPIFAVVLSFSLKKFILYNDNVNKHLVISVMCTKKQVI